ncbi:MAG TPA: YihY/virulence factor BrkB family protein [Flavisolibacter sp.]|jgi:membrane protein|nr:YihY/virulence factor BrkB family protein [Flavisolibacter sp.]
MRKKVTAKGIWQVLKDAFRGFSDDKVVKLSGALAYFTVFSIGPMLIVIIFFADLFYGREAIEGTVYGQIKGFVGSDAAAQIQSIIRNASLSGKSTITAIIGFATLLIGATGVFSEIQDSINSIWNLKPKPKKGWLKLILNRLLSFSVVISLGFILLVSLVVNGLIEGLMDRLQMRFPHMTVVLLYIINLVITFVVTTTLFGIIFKVLPDAIIKWRDVITGAMTTAVLFMIGKFAITFYIGSSSIGTTYGTAGSLVVLLSWIYYSSIILYFGAEFTKAYAACYGSRIMPNHYAVWVKQIEVEEENGTLKQQEQKKKEQNENTDDNITVK